MRRKDGFPKAVPRRYPYGVSYRRGRAKPWIVKFNRNKRTKYIGSFEILEQAALAAEEFLKNEVTANGTS